MEKFQAQQFISRSGRSFNIRELAPDDADQLCIFLDKIANETTHTLRCKENAASSDKLRETLHFSHQSKHELGLGVFDQTLLVGNLKFRLPFPENPWIKHIGEFGMGILQEYWNQGMGKELLSIMENFAKSLNASRIEAKVRCTNYRGINLYINAGFKIEGTRKNAALINKSYEDEYFIAKLLA